MLYNNPKPQDTKEGLSDQDFSIYMDAHTVPFSKYPSYMPAGVLGICTEGNAEIQVGLRKYVNPEKPDVPLNKNDAFQKVQKRHVQEKR